MTFLNILRHRLAIVLTLLGAIALASPAAGFAQGDSPGTGPVDVGACGVYDSQADAQAALDADPSLAPELDGDGNGIACEGGFAGDDEDDATSEDDATADDADEATEDADDSVSALPSTGAGATLTADSLATQVAGAFALIAAAGLAGGLAFRRAVAGR